MQSISKRTCPECGRLVNVRKNRFGDLIFNHHKMASIADISKADMRLDYQPGYNVNAEPLLKITCPNSGQVVEDTNEK